MLPSHVGIVGFGIGGGALAVLLARAGHRVTLCEQAPHVGPVGAGLLLQPSGQAVLHRLGLLELVATVSEPIHGLRAVWPNGGTLIHLRHADVGPGRAAYGVHRGTLFQALHGAVRAERVEVRLDCRIAGWQEGPAGVVARDARGGTHGPFAVLVVADGARSGLRRHLAPDCRAHVYPYGAAWAVGRCTQVRGQLHQVVAGTQRLLGLLPVGGARATLFWGLRRDQFDACRRQGFAAWRGELERLCPLAAEVLEDVGGFERVIFTDYRHVQMGRPYRGRVVCLGDAAHATSPHLGQGANLALLDAAVLADALALAPEPAAAFRHFYRLRRRQVRFYALLSWLLTPFFQSDLRPLALGRDLALPLMVRVPPLRRLMARAMAGVQQGLFAPPLDLSGLPPVPRDGESAFPGAATKQ